MTTSNVTTRPIDQGKALVVSALVTGGLFGAISVIGQTLNQGFDNIRIQGVIMPMLMGAVAGGIIAYLVVKNRRLLTDQLDLERQHSADLSRRVDEQTVELRSEVTERTAAQQQAEAANKAKSEFLSSMSHELRTPLNAVLGFAQLLEQDKSRPLDDKQRESVDYILKGGTLLLELIDQVLELSKIEAGEIAINIEAVSALTVFDNCIALVQGKADQNNIAIIDQTSGPDDYLLSTDRVRLIQVVSNLLSNAVKYNRPGGTVTLSCRQMPNRMLRILVADTGLGIPSDKHCDLFKPFDRLGREAGTIEGSGIGMTISKQITEQLSGQIGFESVEDVGSTFWVDIPLNDKYSPSLQNNVRQLAQAR